MIQRYRTKVLRVQAFKVTAEMLDGIEPWPEGTSSSSAQLMVNDYMVKWPGAKTWLAMPGAMFEHDYESDEPGALLRIAT